MRLLESLPPTRVPNREEAYIPRRAAASTLLIGFRIITAVAFAAGVGALVAGVVTITMSSRSDAGWAASFSRFALALGGVPAGADWEVVHPSGDAIARVLRENAGRGFAKYVAMIGQHEACRFKWALHGLSVMSAELEVECAGDGPARLDRALAIAIAPILEQ